MSQTTWPPHWANSSGTLFKNPWPSAEEPSWLELLKDGPALSWYEKHGSGPEDIKVVKPDWGAKALQAKTSAEKQNGYLIGSWLGHAGAHVEVPRLDTGTNKVAQAAQPDSVYLVFDPIFSYRAGPTAYTGPARFRRTPCEVADLPGCEAIFISHNHYDHLDLATVTAVLKRFPDTLWFVPLRNKEWLVETGVKADNIIELDWWDKSEKDLKGQHLKITCTPAQHNSARSATDKNKTLWCGWAIERFVGAERKGAIYHAGDTGYRRLKNAPETCPAFKEIGAKFSGFDLSFIPIWRGGTLGFISYFGLRLNQSALAAVHHAYPSDSVEIHKDVRSKNTIGMHFGTFVGSENESRESVKEFREACEKSDIPRLSGAIGPAGRADLLDIGASIVIDL